MQGRQDETPEWMNACRAFVDAVGDQMLVVGHDYTVLLANQAFLDATGATEEQVVGRPCHEVSHRTSEPCWRHGEACPLANVLESEKSVAVTHEHVGATGGKRLVSIVGAPIRNPEGKLVGMVESLRDITEQKALEQALVQRNDDLEASRRKHQQFIAVVCHELKNVLNSLSLNVEVLRRREPAGRHIERIRDESQRLARLVDDMRDVDAIESQRFTIDRHACDLGALLADSVEVFRMASERKRIRLELPPSPILGQWDPQRLRQVVDNLLSNALKYSPADGEITVTATRGNESVSVSVADSGGGVADGELAQLFEPYSRGRHDVPGMGLGLYLSRGIVQAHGGELSVTSEGDQGTTFTFWLPSAREA